jgi:hypothetical protein
MNFFFYTSSIFFWGGGGYIEYKKEKEKKERHTKELSRTERNAYSCTVLDPFAPQLEGHVSGVGAAIQSCQPCQAGWGTQSLSLKAAGKSTHRPRALDTVNSKSESPWARGIKPSGLSRL